MSKRTKILKTNISHISLNKVAELLVNEHNKKMQYAMTSGIILY